MPSKKKPRYKVTRVSFLNFLAQMSACQPAQEWAYRTSGTPRQLWNKCNIEPTWLVWLVVTASRCLRRDCSHSLVNSLHAALDRSGVRFWNDYALWAQGHLAGEYQSSYERACKKITKQQSDIVRERVPWDRIEKMLLRHHKDVFRIGG